MTTTAVDIVVKTSGAGKLDSLAGKLKKAETEVKRLQGSIEKQGAANSLLKQKLSELTGTYSKISAAQQKFGDKNGKAAKRLKELKAEIDKTKAALRSGLELNLKNKEELVKAKAGFKKLGDEVKQAGKAAAGATGQFNGLKSALAGLGLAALAKQVIGGAASFEQLELRIKVLSQEFGEFDRVQRLVQESAKQFGQSQAEAARGVSDVYARLRPLGVELADIEKVYKGFNATAIASGTSAEAASSAFLQLSQALGSGRLQGDEFRSIAEQVPGILSLVADELGVTVGELKQLSSDGKITSDVLINALAKGFDLNKGKIQELLAESPAQKFKDFSNAVQELSNAFGSELLPAIIPLVKSATDLVRAIGDLPDPVKKTIAQVLIFTAKVLLLKKALDLIIGLRAGLRTVLIGLAGNAKLAGDASLTAAGKVKALAASLRALALIGIVTVGVEYVVMNARELEKNKADLDALRGRRGAGAEGRFAGESYEQAVQRQKAAQITIDAALKEKKALKEQIAVYDALGKAGTLFVRGQKERLAVLNARLIEAQQNLQRPLPAKPRAVPTPKVPIPDDGLSGGGGGGGGGGGAAAPTDDLAALQARKDLLEQLAPLQKQLNLAQVTGNQIEIARLENEKALVEQKYAGLEALRGLNTEAGRALQTRINELELTRVIDENSLRITQAEKERADQIESALRPLEEEERLLRATIAGRLKEEQLLIRIENIMRDLPESERATVEGLVRGNAALKERAEQAQKLKDLYNNIAQQVGSAIDNSIVAAIDSAVDSTKDLGAALQEIASSLLKDVGRLLIRTGINSLMPTFAAGGRPEVGRPSIVGENGPEIFIPDSAGRIDGSEAFNAARQAMTTSSAVQSSTAALDREQEQIEAMQNPSPIDIRYDSTVINNTTYVTEEQMLESNRRAVKEARARVFSDMRNKPATRAQLGIG